MRDTDADWKAIGEADPYWGVYTCDACRTENLTAETLERLYQSGVNDVQRFRRTFRRYFGAEFKPRRVLDFGCGVGRLVLAIAPHVENVIGVDVSAGMLRRAEERAKNIGACNVAFAEEFPIEQFDWVNAFIVLQHIPPRRGLHLIQRLAGAVREGAFLSLHVTAFHLDGTASDPDETGAEIGNVCMYDYPLNQVCAALYAQGFADLYLDPVEHDRHVGYIVYARKGHYFEARENYSDLERAPASRLVRALARKALRRFKS